MEHAIAGTGGGLVAAALLYPLDSVRTRLQVGKTRGGDDSFTDLVATLRQHPQGYGLLYRGLRESLATVTVSQAVYFFWYVWFAALVLIYTLMSAALLRSALHLAHGR